MTIDNIVFGNPSQEDYTQIRTQSILDDLFPNLRKKSAPSNSQLGTQQELNEVIEAINNVNPESDQFQKWQILDKSLVPFIKNSFITHGADSEQIHSLLDNVVYDVLPLCTKLKYEFNRPRPAQLAHYYQLKLMPYFSNFAHSSPSYPSGHTLICAVVTKVLTHYYPSAKESLQDGLRELAYSRIALGLHYPSDNEFAIHIADKIIDHPEFKKKYGL